MKNIFLLFAIISLPVFAAESGLLEARDLADRGIIVNQSTSAEQSGGSSLADQESAMYRLDDFLIRQEALGIALRLKGITLLDSYICRAYYRDVSEWWVCRAAEMAADFDIVTRENLYFRPHDTLTLAEGLGITMKALDITLSKTSVDSIPGNLPAWQKRLILTIQEEKIALNVRDNNGRSIAVYDSRVGPSISGYDMSYRLTRGEFFQIVVALFNYQDTKNPTAHCTVYNDGCNDCVVGDEVISCTKRACFWEWIPSCSVCELGYTLENNRCVRLQSSCVWEGGYAWGGEVMYPENMANLQCCAWLTRAERADGTTFADAGYTCIRQGDGFCDDRFENSYNSSDCRSTTTFDSSICQSYYDWCNNCTNIDGNTGCTERYCFINGPAYCTSYVSYVPKTQPVDSDFLTKISAEIRHYASDLSCTDTSQCQWIMYWTKACGGPSAAIPYSTKNVTTALMTSKGQYITDAEKKYNELYGIVSDCMVEYGLPYGSCVNNRCQ